jgi:DNA-directed RNA polymerase subunit M/transcription elongation factor TFIIS
MEFCPDCENLLFLKIEKRDSESVNLIYNCKNCSYSSIADVNTQKTIYSNPYNFDKLNYYIKRKEFLRHDPTIPHIDVIPCANKECTSNTGTAANDIFYVSLDDKSLLFLYVCNNCMTHWTNK